MRLSLLASGSNGNALLIERGPVRLLVDAGLGPRRLQRRLEPLGLRAADLTHCVVTHAHDDHAAGLPALIKQQPDVVVLATRAAGRLLPPEARRRLRPLAPGRTVGVGGISVSAVAAAHDSPGTVCLRLEATEGALGIAIDLGDHDVAVRDLLGGCRALVVEANHCPKLLAGGPYPPYLKRRVAGPLGHLSNEQCRALLEGVLHGGLERVFFAHLSAVNNSPEAVWAAMGELRHAFPSGALVLGSREAALPPVELTGIAVHAGGGSQGQLSLPW